MRRFEGLSNFKLAAIVTDCDGTLFGSNLKILDSTKQAIQRARQLGIPVIPCTGRSMEAIVEIVASNELSNDISVYPGIYLNGCLTYGSKGHDDVIQEIQINEDVLRKLTEFVKRKNMEIMSKEGWDKHEMIVNAPPEHGFKSVINKNLKPAFLVLGAYHRGEFVYEEVNQLTDGVRQFREGGHRPVGSLLNYHKTQAINQLSVITHSGYWVEQFRGELTELVGDTCLLANGIPRMLEFVPKGAGKLNAASLLIKHLGLSMDSVAYLGDGENDIDIMKNCRCSISMGNGIEEVKRAAHFVTTDNDNGGWAIAVNKLLDTVEVEKNFKENQPPIALN